MYFLITIMLLSTFITEVKADKLTISEPSDLYGLSALLMDADTGEILFEKNADEQMAVASTTKVLTCLVALEYGNLSDTVIISDNAAKQPDVQMNAAEGEQYRLSDLLKGMMLESYNDISVAVAEHISGSEEEFAELMNQTAVELGCENSYFITPNGLDSEVNGLVNHSTAADMGIILSEAIKNQDFLDITQTVQWEIRELNGKRTVTASNKNRMLLEYEGMISGKTGYTSKAGYCYVGAAKRDNRTLVSVTLGSGWPPNKNYKWSDTKKLLDYGFDNFHYREIDLLGVKVPEHISIEGGVDVNGDSVEELFLEIPQIEKLLLRDDETYTGKVYLINKLDLPVTKNDVLGRIEIFRNSKETDVRYIRAIDDVLESSLWYQICHFLRYFFDKIF